MSIELTINPPSVINLTVQEGSPIQLNVVQPAPITLTVNPNSGGGEADSAQKILKRVWNNSGATIAKGKIVYVNGGHGSADLTIALADKSSDLTSAKTAGYVYETINNNAQGYIITEGFLEGITTNGLSGAEGSSVWLGDDGNFQSEIPVDPDHSVFVGYLVKKAGGGVGSIYVKIQNGYEIDELHDVLITSPTNGQVLTYNSATTLWTNQNASGGSLSNQCVDPFIAPPSSGKYVPCLTATGYANNAISGHNSMRMVPFVVGYDMTINAFEVYVVTGAADTAVEIVLYDAIQTTGFPTGTPLRSSGLLPTTVSAATVVFTFSGTPLTLTKGRTYWIGMRYRSLQALTATYRGLSPTSFRPFNFNMASGAMSYLLNVSSTSGGPFPDFTTNPWNITQSNGGINHTAVQFTVV